MDETSLQSVRDTINVSNFLSKRTFMDFLQNILGEEQNRPVLNLVSLKSKIDQTQKKAEKHKKITE